MTKIFAALAVLLIVTGTLVLAVPAENQDRRGIAPTEAVAPPSSLLLRARELAEKANAPLSILFGLVSLYYSRRTYLINRDRAEAERGRSA